MRNKNLIIADTSFNDYIAATDSITVTENRFTKPKYLKDIPSSVCETKLFTISMNEI